MDVNAAGLHAVGYKFCPGRLDIGHESWAAVLSTQPLLPHVARLGLMYQQGGVPRSGRYDSFRRSLSGGGKRLMTAGIAALPPQDQAAILAKVMAFDAFTGPTIRTANTTSARSITRGTASSGRSTITI